jgi:glycosyltransferase involved in cell wall biosynthesis
MVDIARRLPEYRFDLYGYEGDKTIVADLTPPDNVRLLPPVYGEDKARVLRDAALYLQTSRWEVFGISVAEAMMIGLPCAIAESMDLAQLFRDEDLGLVIPLDTASAAAEMRRALQNAALLERWSERARHYAYQHFLADHISQKYVAFYDRVISNHRRNRSTVPHPASQSARAGTK